MIKLYKKFKIKNFYKLTNLNYYVLRVYSTCKDMGFLSNIQKLILLGNLIF